MWSPSPHTCHSHMHTPTPHTLFTHTHMPTPLQEDKCRLLPQPKPVTTEGEEGEEPLLNKMADQWMSTRDLMKVCTCIHTQCWPQRMSARDMCCGTVHFCLVLSVLLYRVRIYVYICAYICMCVYVCANVCVFVCLSGCTLHVHLWLTAVFALTSAKVQSCQRMS